MSPTYTSQPSLRRIEYNPTAWQGDPSGFLGVSSPRTSAIESTTDTLGRTRAASASRWQPSPELAADLEAAYAALPPPSPAWASLKGSVGQRLQERHTTNIPADLLKECAREELGAKRINDGYLATLRIVLGNQAHAERHGYDLELNVRTPFAQERPMRTILDQMAASGVTKGRSVLLGGGRRQVIQCFAAGRPRTPLRSTNRFGTADDADELEWRYRLHEGVSRCDAGRPPCLQEEDIPAWPMAA